MSSPTKAFTAPLALKDDATPGAVQAVFSTFNVLDKQGDVVLPGAFPEGVQVPLIWAHEWDSFPVGKGTILVQADRAVFDGAFHLQTQHSRDAYETVKAMGALQEYSYGFDIAAAEMGDWEGQPARLIQKFGRIYEVSPVLVGAGERTGTLAIKSTLPVLKMAIGPHKTATATGAWDGPAQQARLSNDAGAATYRKAAAWIDPEADPDTKAAYRFWHHFVSADGTVGAASTVACSTGIGVLNGGRGGTTIPSGEKQGVWAHLAGHLRDAGLEPPPLKAWNPATAEVAVMCLELVEHLDTLQTWMATAKAGRVLAERNWQRIQQAHGLLQSVMDDATGEPAATNSGKGRALRLAFDRIQARLAGVPV